MNRLFPENSYMGKCSCGDDFIAPKYTLHCSNCLYKRIVELEAYLQKVQADRINDIAIERKRWAKADLVALEILRLEQQIKGVNDFANKFCGDCKTLEQAAVSYCAESFIKSLKEPKP
jgi:hypothetical protein